MSPVAYQSLASHVIFGAGALGQAPDVARALGMTRVMVIATRSQAAPAARLMDLLGPIGAVHHDGAAMHTPVEVTLEAMEVVKAQRIDGLVALGGGSAIGLAKAIALRTDLPQLHIPTTYAGSEMTAVVGQTEAGTKTTLRDARVLAEAVIYDVDLTLGLPVRTSVTSGFNAMAHGVEALYSKGANALLSAVAQDCVRLMAHALPRLASSPADVHARTQALGAAWLGGWSLANGGSALHHRLCHILGGSFGLPHAETHTILLPHVLSYNAPAVPDAIQRLQRALDVDQPAQELWDLSQSLGAPRSLHAIGLPESAIPEAVARAMDGDAWNPMPLEPAALAVLLRRAWRGEGP